MYVRMNSRYLLMFLLCLCGPIVCAQQGDFPKRTPEEQALKQTAMLIRELKLSDSTQIDSIYRIHLRYARMQQDTPSSREEQMGQMQQMVEELKGVLTKSQLLLFNSRQSSPDPRRPRQPVGSPSHPVRPERGANAAPHTSIEDTQGTP